MTTTKSRGNPNHWSQPRVALLRRCLPLDLRGLPCYLLTASEAGDAYFDEQAVAYVAMYLDQELQPLLERLGLWEGPGFCTVFPWSMADSSLEILIHELAHYFDDVPFLEHLRSVGHVPDLSTPVVRRHAEHVAASPCQRPPWHGHGDRWIRCVLHLAHRASRHERIDAGEILVAGRQYGLSHWGHYAEALWPELIEREEQPLTTFLQEPYPPAFADLWRRDTGRELQKEESHVHR